MRSLAVRRAAPARPVAGVESEVGVEMSRLVEALPADVATEGFLPRVDAVVSLQHADRGEALAAHGAAVRLLLGVPAHVHLQLAREAEALPALLTAVPPLDALPRVGGASRRQPPRPGALHLQDVFPVEALASLAAGYECFLSPVRLRFALSPPVLVFCLRLDVARGLRSRRRRLDRRGLTRSLLRLGPAAVPLRRVRVPVGLEVRGRGLLFDLRRRLQAEPPFAVAGLGVLWRVKGLRIWNRTKNRFRSRTDQFICTGTMFY